MAATITLVTCPARCGKKVNSEDEPLVTFCPGCGKPWKTTGDSAASSSASPPSAAIKVWGGVATYVPPSLGQVIPDVPLRTLALAPLQETLIKKAREGQTFISLQECMQPHAVQGTSTRNSDMDRTIVMQVDAIGHLVIAPTAVAHASQSTNERKRPIHSFADILEAFVHTLIGIFYIDRPDICAQLWALLIQAADIARAFGLETALSYIEYQRLQHYRKAGQAPVHVLSISTDFDMGRFSQEALDAAKNQSLAQQLSLAASASLSAVAGRKPSSHSGNTCRDWNRGGCARSPCKYSHACSVCSSPGHMATDCTQPGAPPVTPSGAPSQPTAGRGGRGGRGRGGRQSGGATPSAAGAPASTT